MTECPARGIDRAPAKVSPLPTDKSLAVLIERLAETLLIAVAGGLGVGLTGVPGGYLSGSILAVAGDDGFRLIVEDTGIGMAPGDLEKALKPFGQIDSRLARKYQGSGLGLPLTKSMVELHGGRLELLSVLGSGTTAVVWLPPARIVWPLLAA